MKQCITWSVMLKDRKPLRGKTLHSHFHFSAAPPQTPSQAIMEMMQCITQGLSVEDRKPQGGKSLADGAAQLLQLPHFDADVLKKLKRRRANNLKGV